MYLEACILFSGINFVVGDCSGSIPVIANSNNNLAGSPPYPEGHEVEYGCSNGYIPEGSWMYTCTGGNWVGGPFSCRSLQCSLLEAPSNGRMIGNSYEVGSLMRFDCNTGYDLVGLHPLVCQVDGNWQPPQVPQCQIKTCPAIPYLSHGHYVPEVTVNGATDAYGASHRAQCDPNHLVVGPTRITCNENGEWGPETKPSCEPVTCDPYPGLDSECISKVRLAVSNTLLFLICSENGTLVGNGKSASCINNQWNDLSMRCKCHCKVNADPDLVQLDNLNDNGLLDHNEVLIWSCKQGATKVTTDQLRCIDGVVGTPVCSVPPTVPTPKPTSTHTTPKPTGKGTTDKNTTGPDDDSGGMSPLAIVFIAIGGIAVLVGAIIAIVKKNSIAELCKKGNNRNTNSKPPENPKEAQPLTVRYTDGKDAESDLGGPVVQPADEEKVPIE